MNNDLDFFGDSDYTAEQLTTMRRELEQKRIAEHEQQQETRRKLALGLMTTDQWNPTEFEKETARQEQEFRAFAAQRDKAEHDRIEAENAFAFMTANPRYKKTADNSANIASYLKQNELQATTANLQRAYEALQPILDLKPAPLTPPKVFTTAELYAMPLTSGDDWSLEDTSLEGVIREQAARNKQLGGGR
jgi:hypothetical protein